MKTVRKMLFLAGLAFVSACADYLDIVPDGTMKIENIFIQRSEALHALAKVYSYIPPYDATHMSPMLLGDEWIGRIDYDNNNDQLIPFRIMRGLQSVESTPMGYWSGTGQGDRKASDLYEGIRQANVFLQYIHLVPDMTDDEKADWSAQVKFLKAYYHFILLQHYGPIVIVDNIVDPGETSKDILYPSRSKVEDCFDYIINLIDEAIPKLSTRTISFDLGQIDQTIAKSIKARVLLFRASPFFNGNRETFGDFYDHDGEPFFPQVYDREKWKDALDAINDAITACESVELGLYRYNKVFYTYDTTDIRRNPERMQMFYDLRCVITDPWNKELVWGYSNINNFYSTSWDEIPKAANIRLPSGADYQTGGGRGPQNSTVSSGQWLAATYNMVERYYTKNGLPIDEDPEFDENKKYNIVTTPGIEDPGYDEISGLMQPGVDVINLYLNRELRFYANLGISGGYFRSHRYKIKGMMFYNAEGGRDTHEEYLCTGIGVQKFVHPESASDWTFWQIPFPYPIIRMADLYLMKAEVLNEYYDTPTQEVYDAINKVRQRAGIPDVEDAWKNAEVHPDYHLSKDGMREIILRERSIELAFEGSRYWDMIRHRRATTEFSNAILGWNTLGESARTFFVLEPKQSRKFSTTNYLFPIDLNEINTNSNLIQNPGW
jgi:hypothetical protein